MRPQQTLSKRNRAEESEMTNRNTAILQLCTARHQSLSAKGSPKMLVLLNGSEKVPEIDNEHGTPVKIGRRRGGYCL